MIGYANNPFENLRQSNILGFSGDDQQDSPVFRPRPLRQRPATLPDPMQTLRTRNLTGGVDNTSGSVTGGPASQWDTLGGAGNQPNDNSSQFYQELARMQSASNPATDAYRSYLKTQPDPEDYKPNVMTRIAASLSGLSAGMRDPAAGYHVADEMLSAPYKEAVDIYQRKGAGLKEAATIEKDDMTSKINMLKAAQAAGMDYDKYKLELAKAEETAKHNRATESSGATSASAAMLQAQKGNWQPPQAVKGGFLYNNASTGEQKFVAADTIAEADMKIRQEEAGIKAGELGVSKGNLQLGNRRADIEQQVANTGQQAQNTRNWAAHNPQAPLPGVGATDTQVLNNLGRRAEWKQYVDNSAGYPKVVVPSDPNDPHYKLFLEAIDSETARLRAGGR